MLFLRQMTHEMVKDLIYDFCGKRISEAISDDIFISNDHPHHYPTTDSNAERLRTANTGATKHVIYQSDHSKYGDQAA